MQRIFAPVNQNIFFNIVSLTKTRVQGPDEIYTYNIFIPGEQIFYHTNNQRFFRDIPNIHKTVIGISLYNEDYFTLFQTLSSIFENKLSQSSSSWIKKL